MPFLQDAQRAVAAPETPEHVRVTLEFLLANAVGRNNAIPLEQVLGHLDAHEYAMNGPKFQTTILADTRRGGIFIGSGSHGYYLIETQEDAQATLDFYQSRIASEVERIRHLRELAADSGWNLA